MQLVTTDMVREKRKAGNHVLNILTSIFIMIELFGTGRVRFQVILGLAALVIAPFAFGLVDGADGLTFSLVGAGAALFLTIPLSLLGLVSRTDVIVSIALGGMLGAVQYAIVYCIATAFLAVQRMFGVDFSATGPAGVSGSSPYGTGLLAFDEKSALVEIEAMRILRMDRGALREAQPGGNHLMGESGDGAGHAYMLPWCAKLAVATLVVLMIGISM